MNYQIEMDKLYIKYADNPVAMECLEGFQDIFSHYARDVIKRYEKKTVISSRGEYHA